MLKKIPNILTIGRIIIVPIFVVTFFIPGFFGDLIPFFLFVLASFTDYLDGLLARLFKEESKLGELLDPIADKILVSAALILLVMNGTIKNYEVIAAVIILTREILVSGLREFLAKGKITMEVTGLSKLKTLIHKQNHLYLFSVSLTGMVYIVNLCFSVIDIFLNQTGSGSLTSLLSFVILVLMKLNNSYTVGRKSNLDDLALSGYLIESASFNVLDKDEYPEIEELDSNEELDSEDVVSLDLNDVDVKIKGI